MYMLCDVVTVCTTYIILTYSLSKNKYTMRGYTVQGQAADVAVLKVFLLTKLAICASPKERPGRCQDLKFCLA
jgi:hypothetical protein